MKKQKVCIIGGGLAGLITAATLSKLNLKIDLVTGVFYQHTRSNRSTAISQDNYDNLKKLKVLKNFNKTFWPCTEMKIYAEDKNRKLKEIFEFNKKSNKEKKKVLYMVENLLLQKSIIKNLKKEKKIKFISQTNVTKIFSEDSLKTVKFEGLNKSKYNLVIMCTGNNSELSKKYFDDKIFKYGDDEISITAVLKHNEVQNNVARQIFLDDGILALLPISNKKTSIVWSTKRDIFNKYKNNEKKFFYNKIKFYTKNFFKEIKLISKIEIKNLNLMLRKNYYKDRTLLFGDALHVVHPLVGQGLNMTLRDLNILNKILKNRISLGLDIGASDILVEFSNNAKSVNLLYSMGIDFFRNSFTIENKYMQQFRNNIIEKLNKNNIVKNIFFDLADKGLRF